MNSESEKYAMGIDLSGPFSSFSLRKGTEIIQSRSILLENRNNFSFFDIFFSTLEKAGVGLREISSWHVGIGPGSFTGLRVATSFVLGIIFGKKDIKVRVIPSALPLSAMANSSPGEKIAVLYYASKGEILIYDVENADGFLVSKKSFLVSGHDKLALALEDYEHIIFQKNKFIDDILPHSLNDKAKILDSYPAEQLFANNYILPDHSLGDLIYVR